MLASLKQSSSGFCNIFDFRDNIAVEDGFLLGYINSKNMLQEFWEKKIFMCPCHQQWTLYHLVELLNYSFLFICNQTTKVVPMIMLCAACRDAFATGCSCYSLRLVNYQLILPYGWLASACLLPAQYFHSALRLGWWWNMISTRDSNELGAGRPRIERLAVYVVLFLDITESIVVGVILVSIRNIWGYAYSNVKEVI